MIRVSCLASFALLIFASAGLADEPKVGDRLERRGDEIVVCGQLFHTGTPVVTWMDPGGYDAYRTELRFGPIEKSAFMKNQEKLKSPNRYGIREAGLTPEQLEKVRGGGWDLPMLQGVVDQFVIHYDVAGASKTCFRVLHDERALSVQFMLDLDGTIYQTLDLKERAYHASIANTRSIGIEIANMGAYANINTPSVTRWYGKDAEGKTRLTLPNPELLPARSRDLVLRPSRDQPVVGKVQGTELQQYDLTPQQYEALIKLTATLCTVFPKITCDYPRGSDGQLVTRKLGEADFKNFHGVLGHYHVQANKTDPGPAFQWDTVIDGAKKLMKK
ncbi:N-acetylmuramoyl-L-alanine amidase [Tundrisphaera sp. TA3]|uniref:N-acetylmuramoyl-L-alanine amidase n=1 Tax=Tundrisphaera sp. TA3 TaxID=3435775 RepID=UPI003EBC6626